jgi:hypothetical protein
MKNKILLMLGLMLILSSCQKEEIQELKQNTTEISFVSDINFPNTQIKEINSSETQNVLLDCSTNQINTDSDYVILSQSDTLGIFKVSQNNEISLRGYPFHQLTFGGCSTLSIKILY